MSKKKASSIRQQYESAKARHPDSLLLFRIRDSYQLFGADAETAAQVLGLTITRSASDDSLLMAGIPHHQLEAYLHKLIREGYRVAIREQVSFPDEGSIKFTAYANQETVD